MLIKTVFLSVALLFFSLSPLSAGEFVVFDQKAVPVSETEELVIETKEGGRHIFQAELARGPKAWKKGLMFRTEMPENHGMLFVFRRERERGFWMKNTFIPLDMIFIRADGLIHHIHENAVPQDLDSIPSKGPALAVLEINGGLSGKLDIKRGDSVHHAVFSNKLAE